jgi:hypothetical protein
MDWQKIWVVLDVSLKAQNVLIPNSSVARRWKNTA